MKIDNGRDFILKYGIRNKLPFFVEFYWAFTIIS